MEGKNKMTKKIFVYTELDPANYYVIKAETLENANVIMKEYFDKIKVPADLEDLEVEEYDIPEGEGLIAVIDGGYK